MGTFTSLLTVAFIVLKLVGTIGWSWFFVLLPIILYIALQVFLFVLLIAFQVHDKMKNR